MKVLWVIIILLIVGTGILFIRSLSVKNELTELRSKEQNLHKDIDFNVRRINEIKEQIPTRTKQINELLNEIDVLKIKLNPNNINPISGYTVKSYSEKRGNRTNTRNYIYYK